MNEEFSKEDLKFHDGGHEDVLFDKGDVQTHTFTDFPNTAVDEEEEEGDKSELLKEDQKTSSFWTFEYYQQFFDVETGQVFNRILWSMIPKPTTNYLQDRIRPKPDLYGPFWICTTLVFTTAIAGNLANYLGSGGKDYQWKYDFHKVTFAATAIFSYWWLVPAGIWSLLWWRGSQAGYTFLEIICVYGYSLAIFIPISILWVINISWLQWLLVILGALLSGGVLMLTFWPAIKNDTRRVAVIVISLILIFHALLAAGFVLYFFYVPSPSPPSTTVATPTTAKPVANAQNQQVPGLAESKSHMDDASKSAQQNVRSGGGVGHKGTVLGGDQVAGEKSGLPTEKLGQSSETQGQSSDITGQQQTTQKSNEVGGGEESPNNDRPQLPNLPLVPQKRAGDGSVHDGTNINELPVEGTGQTSETRKEHANIKKRRTQGRPKL